MRKALMIVLAIAAAATGLSAAWIPLKALAAQALLQVAWRSAVASGEPVKPWPWADMHPVIKLEVPRVELDSIVLSNASGRTLAFGPGHVAGSVEPGERGVCLISAHRDTDFSPLQHVVRGDRIHVENAGRERFEYEVVDLQVVNEKVRLAADPAAEMLVLSTCYPFDAIRAGGDLRFLVISKRVGRGFVDPA